jgi:hypothetical protein
VKSSVEIQPLHLQREPIPRQAEEPGGDGAVAAGEARAEFERAASLARNTRGSARCCSLARQSADDGCQLSVVGCL